MKELKRITLINPANPNHTVSLPTHEFEIEYTATELKLTSTKLWPHFDSLNEPIKVTNHDYSSIDIMKEFTSTGIFDMPPSKDELEVEEAYINQLFKDEGRACDQ